jgi:putative chitinase
METRYVTDRATATTHHAQRPTPNARRQAGVFVSALNAAMVHRQINTPKRQAAFLA